MEDLSVANQKNCKADGNRTDLTRREELLRGAVRQKTKSEEIIQHQHKYNTTFLNQNINLRILVVKSEKRSEIQRLLSTKISMVSMSYADKKRVPIPG